MIPAIIALVGAYAITVIIAILFIGLSNSEITERKAVALGLIWPIVVAYLLIGSAILCLISIFKFLIGGFVEIYQDFRQ